MKLPPVRPSSTHSLSVMDVTARLSRRREVNGVVMMGSGGVGQLIPASDIDLLVVLEGGLPRVKMISTTVEGRLTEIYFVQAGELDAWLNERFTLPQESFTAVRMRWIENGQVLFDRTGRLERLRSALGSCEWSKPHDDAEVYAAWYRTQYDLVQTRRLVSAEDEVSWMKADLRLLGMLAELWERYFLVRRLPAQSEKGRIRWMKANDPDFMAAYQACLGEPGRTDKFVQYVELARRVLEPAGGLWSEPATAVELDGGASEEAGQALEVWESWLSFPG